MANRTMMRAYLDMVTAGEFAEAEGFYSDDVKIHVGGHNVASGDYVGLADYNAALGRLMGKVDSFTVAEHDLLVSDDHAVVLSTWNITHGDERAALDHVIVYHTAGDKITELWIVPADSETEARFLA